jgi:hypothetical protein
VASVGAFFSKYCFVAEVPQRLAKHEDLSFPQAKVVNLEIFPDKAGVLAY